MMTTLVNSVSGGMDPRQITQSAQPKANEKTAAEELKTEEQQQVENISTPKVTIGKSPMDVRMYQIHQAADAGILRPVWLEMLEDADMPRMRDLIDRTVKNREAERVADEARQPDKSGRAADGAGQPGKSERATDGAGQPAKSERVAEDAGYAAKSEPAVGSESAVNSSNK